MDAISFPPAPVNEPNLTYAPGQRRARGAARRARPARAAPAQPPRLHQRSPARRAAAAEINVVQPHDHQHVLGTMKSSTTARRRGGDQGRDRRRPGLAGDVDRRPLRDPAQGRRPAGRSVAPAAQRRHHARPVEDRVPGRDRRRLRADRLLAVQRPLRQADPHRPADRQQPRHLEPHRPPAARGLRLRDHAVQLHRDRRQPADRAGADGQHGDLEAVARPSSSPRR